MCKQPEALAILTLHDGSNRGESPSAHPDDAATKQNGGCVDIPHGARVIVHQRRINTSIVSYDPGDGSGQQTFIVPNIDFQIEREANTAAPPADAVGAFFGALQQHCPDIDWSQADLRAYGPPLEEAARSLSGPQHQAMTQDVAKECPVGSGLDCGNTAAIRFLVQSGHLDALSRAFCSAKPATAENERY